MASVGMLVQITQLPKGSFIGTPSTVTRARPAAVGPIERSDTPWVVGLAPAEEPRRNRDRPGEVSSARSSRGRVCRALGSTLTIEKAASASDVGRRAALTVTVSTAGG